jgi:transposase, IS6 family
VLTPFLDGAKLHQPTLFIAGDRDGVLGFWGEQVEAMERNVRMCCNFGWCGW